MAADRRPVTKPDISVKICRRRNNAPVHSRRRLITGKSMTLEQYAYLAEIIGVVVVVVTFIVATATGAAFAGGPITIGSAEAE